MNHPGLVRHSIPLSQHLNKANMEIVTTESVPAVAKREADRSEEKEQIFAISWTASQFAFIYFSTVKPIVLPV